MNNDAVPVVIVTHAGPSDRLSKCLRSLRDAGGAAPIVVDNSGGGRAEHTGVEYVSVENHGYGAAANRGIEVARRRFPDAAAIAVINDDIEVAAGWLAPLQQTLDAGYDVAQPKLLHASSSVDDPAVVNSMGVRLDRHGAGVDVGIGEIDGPEFAESRDIEVFTGGAALYSTDFLDRTGGFDERYFLYYEDVDLALRGAEHGGRYRCVPASVVRHEGGATTQHLGHDVRRMQERNRLWCAARFAAPGTLANALWLSVRRLRHAPRRAHARALLSGVAGMPARFRERRTATAARRGTP